MFKNISRAAIAVAMLSTVADAATTTSTFDVQMTIQAQCIINSTSLLDFGTQGVLSAAVDQSATLAVQCTNTTDYNIGLSAGIGSGASVATRKMTNGAATINYTLYSNAGRTTVWGETIGTNTVSATGNGASQSYTIYGRVPAQTTPAANAYSDTITVTVTY